LQNKPVISTVKEGTTKVVRLTVSFPSCSLQERGFAQAAPTGTKFYTTYFRAVLPTKCTFFMHQLFFAEPPNCLSHQTLDDSNSKEGFEFSKVSSFFGGRNTPNFLSSWSTVPG
jgi:hypothetical protein